MHAIRTPGVHEVCDEKVLLVTKHRVTGAERVDWWSSVKEAEESDLIVLEQRDKVTVEKRKKNWTGLASLLHMVFGKSGTTPWYTRERPLDQREFFESVDDRSKSPKNGKIN
jgi:hypothetical protein